MERYTLLPLDTVAVVDWAHVGDLFYGALTEDGERPILRPRTQAVVQLETGYGNVFHLVVEFGADFDAATAMVERIYTQGSVNLEKWRFHRAIYGSDAYVNGGYEADRAAQEREDARYESAGRWA